MKISNDARLPVSEDIRLLKVRLADLFREISVQVNQISEGRMSGKYGASIAAPTTGSWALGDQVANSFPSELGTAGSKYVIEGWICTVAGTPGTWLQKRFLTGN